MLVRDIMIGCFNSLCLSLHKRFTRNNILRTCNIDHAEMIFTAAFTRQSDENEGRRQRLYKFETIHLPSCGKLTVSMFRDDLKPVYSLLLLLRRL
jgi:hypothetical protein